ncbi:hypothetical protein [Fuscibacter oryzae]|uniref:hypothetical protein n=1 Tax=Fuscibacter oryzae TaxID=2803939 RepID=UPI00192C07A1|nr:hypothetical protein [Fuscibacter oryzae]
MLEDFALRYFDLSLTQLALLSWLIILAGGVVGWLMPQGATGITRAPYFAIKAALVLALAQVGHIAMQVTVPSLVGEYYWAAPAMQAAGLLVFGFITVRLAAARSRDAFGHGNLALLCLVPLLSLILTFKRSKGDPALRRVGNRSLLTGEMGVFVGGFLLVLSVALNNYVQEEQAKRVAQANVDDKLKGDFLRFRLRKVVDKVQLPRQQGEGVMVVAVELRDKAVHFRYVADRPADRYPQWLRGGLVNKMCGETPTAVLVKAGAAFVMDIEDQKGAPYATMTVDAKACGFQPDPS